ncbi:hypothetical protein LCGC14_0259470 [marine sediment metagenome]|uniref:Uncharacterized protein n=1 Tax=marine sediment metagenome TaxID=412755 RepID=A0A0F9UJE9_9ZZZZ
MTILVETTPAERESWAALDSVPDEDGLQRLISDAARAAEFEGVMNRVRGLLDNAGNESLVGRRSSTARQCSRCGASGAGSQFVWSRYPDEPHFAWHCEDESGCAGRAKKETG